MKSKKLLILIIAVVLAIVVIVVLASVFAVKEVRTYYHNFEGGEIRTPDDAPTPNDVLSFSKGRSILFLSKSKLVDQLNDKFDEWHAIGVVKSFPNILEVHFVRRVPVMQLTISSGEKVYLDSFGFVVDPAEGTVPIDITSAFVSRESKTNKLGHKFEFLSAESNARLKCVTESIMAVWQCKCDLDKIPTLLGKSNVFHFDDEGALLITTRAEATIRVYTPENDLTERLIKAFSVYCDGTRDLQKQGKVITVYPGGKITTDK